jgi:hypothetical protein
MSIPVVFLALDLDLVSDPDFWLYSYRDPGILLPKFHFFKVREINGIFRKIVFSYTLLK